MDGRPIPAETETSLIEIDGSQKSGSGTLVRLAVSLCALTNQPMHMVRIRAKREKPGLRPQHLKAVTACAALCGGRLEGAEVGSGEMVFHPGNSIKSGVFEWDIGTAGSAVMLAFTLIPLALFARGRSKFTIRGGLFQDFAPSELHMEKVLLPILSQMGARVEMTMVRPGYVPRGNGELVISAEPCEGALEPFQKTQRGGVAKIRGVSLASHLENEAVARRMAGRSRELLEKEGFDPEIEIVEDSTAAQKGAALLLWAETDDGCIIGSDMAGKRGRSSEEIGRRVVETLLADLATGAAVDRFAADQLILFAGLAGGRSRYTVPRLTGHIESNLWLIEKILGAGVRLEQNLICIDGIGFF